MAEEIAERPGTALAGLMAYEGQIAGVGDRIPGSAGAQRRDPRDAVAVRARHPLAAAAGSSPRSARSPTATAGSSSSTAAAPAASRAPPRPASSPSSPPGSGFYAPALFDNYRSLELEPAAFFCLPVVRRPVGGVATVLGGGYLASGAATADRLPEPYLPGGLRFDRQEGAGEVQSPLLGAAAYELRVGDRVYLRHAKAGELCERFDRLFLVEGEGIVDEVPTYRGEGQTFLVAANSATSESRSAKRRARGQPRSEPTASRICLLPAVAVAVEVAVLELDPVRSGPRR